VATQDRLDVLLKIFTELANLFLNAFSAFTLRHSVFTYLSWLASLNHHQNPVNPVTCHRGILPPVIDGLGGIDLAACINPRIGNF
jgi:hypothetical protein